MPSDIEIRFGKTRGAPVHYFRVQMSWDGGQSFGDAIVMKRDDGNRPDKSRPPYEVEWAATTDLEREAEAALGRLAKRYSAKHTKNALRRFLKGVSRHYVPADAEIPVDLGVRIANSPFRFERQYGPVHPWEQEADAAALRKAAATSSGRKGNLPGKERLLGLVRSRYPGWLGFGDPRFNGARGDEVELATVAKAKELLSEKEIRRLVDAGDHSEMIERLKTIGGHNNLLYAPWGSHGDLALLYHEDLDRGRFCEAFLDLVYGDGDVPHRLDRYAEWVRATGLTGRANKWLLPTYFLFFLYRDEDILVKPGTVRTLLKLGGWDGELGVEPSGEGYTFIRTVYSELREALEEHEPRDMIDVHGFAWVAVQEANNRARARKLAREPGHEQDPRIEQAMAEFEQEADAHDLIKRQGLLDQAQSRLREILETVAEKLSMTGILPSLPDDASRGERLVALKRALVEMPPKYGRENWGPEVIPEFYYSKAFERHFPDTPPPPQGPSLESLIRSLQRRGLHFPHETVANYILALQTKRFAILTGVSGTGKTSLAIKVAQHFGSQGRNLDTPSAQDAGGKRGGNYTVVPVRPDWVDSRGLLGYYNPLTADYLPTPFLSLLLVARAERKRAEEEERDPAPFFVVLDEMNLARVEHYFSDFLSAMESGEAIPLHDDASVERGEGETGVAIPRRLRVPDNVFFTGTVNVDETTYMFSPKVLDRAFTIELNEVDLRGYESGDGDVGASALKLDAFHPLCAPDRRKRDGDDGKPGENEWKPNRSDYREFCKLSGGRFRDRLLKLHGVLEQEHRHFGYRVANEIARFVTLAREQSSDKNIAAEAAFDLAVLQKVLPKLHGTQQELEPLLGLLFDFAVEGRVATNSSGDGPKLDKWSVVKRPRSGGCCADSGSGASHPSSSDRRRASGRLHGPPVGRQAR